MIKLIHGDCLEEMARLESRSIDMVLTSPPYDNLRQYENQSTWNFDIFKKIANELKRLLAPGGVIVWVVGDATIKGSETGSSFRQALHFKDLGLRLHDTMIYQKDSFPFPDTRRYYNHFEYMFILSNGTPKTINLISDKPNKQAGAKVAGTRRNKNGALSKKTAVKNKTNRKIKPYGVRGNVWLYQIGKWKSTKDAVAFEHPAIFPEKLARDHILSWSNEGDLILDPFCGSGTVGKMCKQLNRNFIGMEAVKEYLSIAEKRIHG